MVALNTAVDLKSLHPQFQRASVRHALKMITSQVQFRNRHIKNILFFAILPNLRLHDYEPHAKAFGKNPSYVYRVRYRASGYL